MSLSDRMFYLRSKEGRLAEEDVKEFIKGVMFDDVCHVITDVEKRLELQARIKKRAGEKLT